MQRYGHLVWMFLIFMSVWATFPSIFFIIFICTHKWTNYSLPMDCWKLHFEWSFTTLFHNFFILFRFHLFYIFLKYEGVPFYSKTMGQRGHSFTSGFSFSFHHTPNIGFCHNLSIQKNHKSWGLWLMDKKRS